MSGGGAVFHDIENLNFSFMRIGKTTIWIVRSRQYLMLYVIWDSAEYTGRNDISVDGKKFSGNAFCIRGDNELHHGTL